MRIPDIPTARMLLLIYFGVKLKSHIQESPKRVAPHLHLFTIFDNEVQISIKRSHNNERNLKSKYTKH